MSTTVNEQIEQGEEETTTEPEPEQEGEEEGEEEETTTEPELEPEPEGLSEKQLEAALDKLDRETKRHAARVSGIMGEDALLLQVCPFCEPTIPGFFWPNQLSDAQRYGTLQALGVASAADVVDDPQTHTCDYCQGHGVTRTGSKVPDQETRACPKCDALGWATARTETEWESRQIASGAIVPPTPEPQAFAAMPAQMPPNDQYGRPFGHRNYGKSELYLTPEERAADEFIPKG